MNSNMTTNARARTNMQNRHNEATNSLFQGYPESRDSTMISHDNHRSFTVNDIPNIEIFHTDKHGKKCLTPAFMKAMKKYPEQCEEYLNKMYEKRRGPKPTCIRQYLKPVVKPKTKPRGWNLIDFWDTAKGLQRREASSRNKIHRLFDKLERIKAVPPNEKSRWYKEEILNERFENYRTEIKKEQNILKQIEIKRRPTIRVKSKSVLKGTTKQYIFEGVTGYDAKSFLDEVRPQIISLLNENRKVKVFFVLSCNMERVDMKTGEKITVTAHFSSKNVINLDSTDVDILYSKSVDKMMEAMSTYQSLGSNWRLKSVAELSANTIAYKPLRGKSYIPLPPILASKKAIINIKNKDDRCFEYCVARALNPVEKNSERVTEELRKHVAELCMTDIEFPVAVDANVYGKFEKNNNVNVNVFGYEKEDGVFPIYISNSTHDRVVDLLLISDGNKKHYCWIKSFNKLMANRTEKSHNSMHYCKRCLQGYRTEKSLNKHNEYCLLHGAQKIELPKPGSEVKFQNYNRSMRVPFAVYADFESLIKPIDTCQPDPSKSYTNKYQKHVLSSFCYKIVTTDNSYKGDLVSFTAANESDDVAQIFMEELEKDVKRWYERTKFSKAMILTKDDERMFDEATTCHICDEELGEDRVKDHCHITGEFRGAAHNSCNINYKIPKFIPVYFHNLSNYDGHLLIKKLRGTNNEKIKCIPSNEEKYISFSREVVVDTYIKNGKKKTVKRELRFLDSFRFMKSSLDSLTKNLTGEQFKHLNRFCKKINCERHLDLLLRKGIYPYDYMDSLEKLNETRLPPKSAFYSKLNNVEISNEDYAHAKTVWKEFGCETMRDYHNLYNKCDVLQLADVFENFRDVCMTYYKLDPAWYYTSPGLSWDAMLKMTGVKLKLLNNYDMVLMIKNGIRGGVSTITTRYGKSNNKYMGEAFDENKPSKFITYLDANNLYGWAMDKPSANAWIQMDD